uniref:Phosphatidate cytidylyltransferase n=1 Tax=Chryseobacterium endophyticum TaxID=1854762 RepID=A0AAU6WQJ0_9FLAO
MKTQDSFFLKLSPVKRGLISLLAAAVVFFLIFRLDMKPLIILIFCWLAFSLVFLFLDWQVILHRKVDDIRKRPEPMTEMLFLCLLPSLLRPWQACLRYSF